MYFALVELNLHYGSGEKVRFGPYGFDDWEQRKQWESRFRRALTLFAADIGQQYRIEPDFLLGQPVKDEDIIEVPPQPEEAVRNLRVLWDRGVIRPTSIT